MIITDKTTYFTGEKVLISRQSGDLVSIQAAQVFIAPISPNQEPLGWVAKTTIGDRSGTAAFPAPKVSGLYAIGTNTTGIIATEGVIQVIDGTYDTLSKYGIYGIAIAGIAITVIAGGAVYAYKRLKNK